MLYPNLLTDRLLRSWVRCRRKAWLDLYGEKQERLWTAHRNLQIDHQQRCFVALMPRKPAKGLIACKKGEIGVLGIRLKGEGPHGCSLEAHPPLLQKIAGESQWGKHTYRPVMAKHGRKITKEIRLSLALFGYLLKPFQKTPTREGLIVSLSNQKLQLETLPLNSKLNSQLHESLEKLLIDLRRNTPPPITLNRRKCTLCCWRGACNKEAKSEGLLSEISGVGVHRYELLKQIGINNLSDLASTDTIDLGEKLNAYTPNSLELARDLISQAKAQRDGIEERINQSPALPELKHSSDLLLYDIESDPDEGQDFLHGFISLKRNTSNNCEVYSTKYQPILVTNEYDESLIWKKLKQLLDCDPNRKILHYGETEVISLCRLAKRQGLSDKELEKLRNRFIDLHVRVRTHWRLPLNSYGLKNVATWMGFSWRKKGVDGARALLWWRHWNASKQNGRGDINSLRWILEYNQDDNLAAWTVASWLLSQDSLLENKVTSEFSS